MGNRFNIPALAVAAVLVAAPVEAAPFFFLGPGATNVDDGSGTIVSLTATTSAAITDLNVSVELSDSGSLFWEDLDMFLIHGATLVQLNTGIADGSSFPGSFDVTFDDEAAEILPDGGQDAVGPYRPDGPLPLSLFDGADLAGLWQLVIVDTTVFSGEGNELVAWSISGTTAEPAPLTQPLSVTVTEPATLAAFGLGLLMLGRVRRENARDR